MEPVLTPDEMRAADRQAIASGTPVEVLMDRAGRAVAWAVRRRLGRTYGTRVVVACGPGNNGGDGRVAARVLRGWGARVDVVDVVEVDTPIDAAALTRLLARADLVVDAMYGTGLRDALTGVARVVCDVLAERDCPVIAVDIPSGVDGLTGETRGAAVWADETVTFAALKPGLLFEPGRTRAGVVQVADIGIPVTGSEAPRTFVTTAADVARWLPGRSADAHKWSSGCFVVGGSRGMTGAPALVAHAALRAGAGIVWCGVPGRDGAAAVSGTEVIARALPDDDGSLAAAAADAVLADVGRFRAVALGPGLGREETSAIAVQRLVSDIAGPIVIDADALRALGGHLDRLRSRACPAVLTPHAGEYEALLGDPPVADRLMAARTLASATGAVVLYKGPGTVVADPTGRAAVCPLGGSWLASAGTGDVLTGIVAAFLARGAPPFEAAAAAAFVHASAADRAGHTGLVAGDLVGALPATLAALPAVPPTPAPPTPAAPNPARRTR